VKLDLSGEEAVRAAYREIAEAVRTRGKVKDFIGVVVQPMIPQDGYELILGSSIDPQFGPVLLFGAGGQLVEVFHDRALGLPPLNRTLARRMMERTLIHRALQGVRGRKAVNLDAVEGLLVRFSQLVVEQPHIKEIDINPLLASPERIIALDARVVLHPIDIADEELPRTAIRPYPAQYISTITLSDGTVVTVRPIRPEDEPEMVKFHQSLSEESVRFRYFGALSVEKRIAHERLVRTCFNDYDREIALVAELKKPEAPPEILGVGRLVRTHELDEAEFAILIADAWQGKGLGSALLKRLVETGRAEKFRRITGLILGENRTMLEVCRNTGFNLQWQSDAGEWKAEIKLYPSRSLSRRMRHGSPAK
jgi:acetyltransferase